MLIKKLLIIIVAPVIIFLGVNYILLPGLESLHHMSRHDIKKGKELFKAKKYKEALPSLVRAASGKNDPDAQRYLGKMYQYGFGIKQDDKKAIFWYKKSFEQGNTNAAINLGNMLRNGKGIKKPDPQTAFKLYKYAANRGEDRGKLYCGIAYLIGLGVEQDSDKAFSIFKTLVVKKNKYALEIVIAHSHAKGNSNPAEAEKWGILAAEHGNPEIYHELALPYLKKDKLSQEEMKKAEQYFIRAVNAGISKSKIGLACLYLNKKNASEDEKEKALIYLISIAEKDKYYPIAQSLIGVVYELGFGVKTDKKKATAFLKKSADLGWELAAAGYAYDLASEHRDLDKATLYIRKALMEEYTESDYLHIYGYILYSQGKYKEALREYQKGDRFSQEPLFKIKKSIGYTYLALGEDTKALKAWAEALTIPEPDEKLKSELIADYITTAMKQQRKISLAPNL